MELKRQSLQQALDRLTDQAEDAALGDGEGAKPEARARVDR
jgi:hypothetical protein